MANSNLLENIPAQDWEATPASVQTLVLSLLPLAEEAYEQRERTSASNNGASLAFTQDKHTREEKQAFQELLRQYHALVNKSFALNFTAEEEATMERLGKEVDAYNAPFYAPMLNAIRNLEANHRE